MLWCTNTHCSNTSIRVDQTRRAGCGAAHAGQIGLDLEMAREQRLICTKEHKRTEKKETWCIKSLSVKPAVNVASKSDELYMKPPNSALTSSPSSSFVLNWMFQTVWLVFVFTCHRGSPSSKKSKDPFARNVLASRKPPRSSRTLCNSSSRRRFTKHTICCAARKKDTLVYSDSAPCWRAKPANRTIDG